MTEPVVRCRFTDGKRELLLLGEDEASARKRIVGYFAEGEWQFLGAETAYVCPGCDALTPAPGRCERCAESEVERP